MRTYPEMDKEIVKLLDMEGMPLSVYAARYIEKLQAENAELRARLEKAVELPVKVGDTIYCIRNCGAGRYRVEEHTVIEIVFEYDNQMRIKTSYGLFGCEKWTFGLVCFADNAEAEAEARLKELQNADLNKENGRLVYIKDVDKEQNKEQK